MTVETGSPPIPAEKEAWPFLEKLDAGTVITVCQKAVKIQRNENRSLPSAVALALIRIRLTDLFNNPLLNRLPDSSSRRSAGHWYHDLLFSIPMAESTINYGLPRHSKDESNYIDLKNLPFGDRADLFLRFQRYAKLLREDPTATTMLENGVMSIFARSGANTHEATVKAMLEHGSVRLVDDLLKPEIKCTLNPQTLSYLQAYCDYRAVYPVAASQKPPQMI